MANNISESDLLPREEKDVIKEIKQLNPVFAPVYKKVFVSYCKHDADDPQWINRVYQFVYCLLALGVDVSVDFLDHSEGNIAFGIANKIELCDRILMINSPEYYKLITQRGNKEDRESKSVAYEGKLIYSEIFNRNGIKVIPIFLKEYKNMMAIIPAAFKTNRNFIFSAPPTCLDLANHIIDTFTQLACLLIGLNTREWTGSVKLKDCKKIELLESSSQIDINPDLDKPLTDKSPERFFSDLVPLVLPFWQCLALELDVDLKKVQEMFNQESEKEKCYQFLYQWWKKQPQATFNDLIGGLKAVIGVDTRQLIMAIIRFAQSQQQQQQQQQQEEDEDKTNTKTAI